MPLRPRLSCSPSSWPSSSSCTCAGSGPRKRWPDDDGAAAGSAIHRHSPRPHLARGGRATRWSVAFGVLRWVVIVLLLLVTLFPFYYTVMLDPAPRSGRPGPGGVVRAAQRVGAGQLSRRARLTRGGWTGLPVLHPQQCRHRSQHGGPHLARGPAGRVRGEPAGVLRPAPDQRPVPGRLPVPEHPAGRAAVRLLRPDRPAGDVGRPAHRVRVPDRRGLDLHAPQLLRHHPGEPGGGRRHRRLHPARHHATDQPAAWRCPRSCPTRSSCS